MTTLEILIDRVQTARRWTTDLINNFEESKWFDAPAPGVGHVAWQLGHLAASQVVLVHARCFNLNFTDHLSASFRDTFGRGSKPIADRAAYPSPADLRGTFDRIHQETIGLIKKLNPAELDAPVYGDPHPMFTNKAGAIGMTAMHESFHAGQIALIRRLAGKDPLR